ncbi:capsular biosynthesis protein [Paraburkholderia sp. A3BS-1L]|uniref:capsule biosynthesis protein n=1 Tax=Paraburkholderia sp. A3BS-1L TaxID=3028375 RepID=UPI003DA9AFBE
MPLSVLFLQGPASPFFRELSSALRSRGHRTIRVNFCGGDLVYGGRVANRTSYYGSLEHLPEWYQILLERESPTDIVLFGDCRPIHAPIHAIAEERQLRVHVFEEGYVRPNWVTLERGGVNGRSGLSRDPEFLLASSRLIPPAPASKGTGYNLRERAWHDICYRLANGLCSWRYGNYRSHRPHNGLTEYAALSSRFACKSRFEREATRLTDQLLGSGKPYFLFPLQLNTDSQITHHSPFRNVPNAIEAVIESFARHAPEDCMLVVKNHPLDTGIWKYEHVVERIAQKYGVGSRIVFLNGGHLPTLLTHAKGVVVINSTVGLSALHHGRPLVTLGRAIYGIPGLTWQDSIDSFWTGASDPDIQLYQVFLNYILHETQINGDFYTRTGIEMAVAGAVQRLEAAEHA